MVRFDQKFPSKLYSENLLQPDLVASASFSVCVYLFSVSDIDRDAYAMSFQVSVVTVLKPKQEASAEILVGATRLCRATTEGFTSYLLLSRSKRG